MRDTIHVERGEEKKKTQRQSSATARVSSSTCAGHCVAEKLLRLPKSPFSARSLTRSCSTDEATP